MVSTSFPCLLSEAWCLFLYRPLLFHLLWRLCLHVLCLGGTAFSATSAAILRKTRALALAWVSVFLISFSRCLSCLWCVIAKLKPFEIVKWSFPFICMCLCPNYYSFIIHHLHFGRDRRRSLFFSKWCPSVLWGIFLFLSLVLLVGCLCFQYQFLDMWWLPQKTQELFAVRVAAGASPRILPSSPWV